MGRPLPAGRPTAIGGIEWIRALRAKEIQALAAAGTIQLSQYDQRDPAEVSSAGFPGERLIAGVLVMAALQELQ